MKLVFYSTAFNVFLQLFLGLGSKAHESIKLYTAVSNVSGVLMLFGSGAAFWHLFTGT
jgi:hypothetical protein